MTADKKQAMKVLAVGALVAIIAWLLLRGSSSNIALPNRFLFVPGEDAAMPVINLGNVTVPPFSFTRRPITIPDFADISPTSSGLSASGSCCASCRDNENVFFGFFPAGNINEGDFIVTIPAIPTLH